MSIVSETEQIADLRNSYLESRGQISDGLGRRFFTVRGNIRAWNSMRYVRSKQSNGSEGKGCPRSARPDSGQARSSASSLPSTAILRRPGAKRKLLIAGSARLQSRSSSWIIYPMSGTGVPRSQQRERSAPPAAAGSVGHASSRVGTPSTGPASARRRSSVCTVAPFSDAVARCSASPARSPSVC
jgi:hypothetical protein